MTMFATPSWTGGVVPRLWFIGRLLAAVPALAPLVGCNLFHSGFPIAVGNRTANTVSIFANGQSIGDVGSNLVATFSVDVRGSSAKPTSPTQVAQVTFSARDMTTGMLSAGTAATLVGDVTTFVDVAPCVLIAGGTAPPCVSISSTPSGSLVGSPVQPCTFSLSASNQSFSTTGGSGNVTVNTSNGCAWSAISSASWVIVLSGSSGTSTGVVAFEVAPNTTRQARTASLSIGDQTLTINQTA